MAEDWDTKNLLFFFLKQSWEGMRPQILLFHLQPVWGRVDKWTCLWLSSPGLVSSHRPGLTVPKLPSYPGISSHDAKATSRPALNKVKHDLLLTWASHQRHLQMLVQRKGDWKTSCTQHRASAQGSGWWLLSLRLSFSYLRSENNEELFMSALIIVTHSLLRSGR